MVYVIDTNSQKHVLLNVENVNKNKDIISRNFYHCTVCTAMTYLAGSLTVISLSVGLQQVAPFYCEVLCDVSLVSTGLRAQECR